MKERPLIETVPTGVMVGSIVLIGVVTLTVALTVGLDQAIYTACALMVLTPALAYALVNGRKQGLRLHLPPWIDYLKAVYYAIQTRRK